MRLRRLFPVLRVVLPALALFAIAMSHNLTHVETTPFHRDESRWVGRAYFLEHAVTDPLGETWEDSELTRNQPPLGSYLMGLGLMLQGIDTDTTRNNRLYDFDHDFEWNVLRGRQPTAEAMEAGRRTNAVVGAILAVTVFLIGWQLAGVIAGAVAGLMLVFHPLATHMSSWAGSDALLALTVALAGLTAIRLVDRPGWGKTLLLGALLGLGAATKISPLLVAAGVGAVGAALLIAGQPWTRGASGSRQQTLGWMFMTTPFVAFATLVAVYPYLWASPIARLQLMLSFRENEMDNQGDIPAQGTPGWTSIAVDGGLPDAISRTRFWLGEALTTGNVLDDWISDRTGWGINLAPMDLVLGVVGIGLLTMLVLLNGPVSRGGAALLILLGQAAVIWVGMRADFDRYQLPILVTLLAGVAVSVGLAISGLEAIVTRARHRRTRPAAPARQLALPIPWRRGARP
ncbi:MAG TPA: phospholipid carrier-dependent glycosyltransferase [Thermomicrobiales bacterium]|nr:phospholipid carrier-dependent glycosyltransferase [Thermomicrobiales bacterium]